MNCCNNTEFVKLPKIWDFLHFETDYVKYDLKWITVARNFSYLTSVIFFYVRVSFEVASTKMRNNDNL